MKRYFFGLVMVAVAAVVLSGCIGSGGSSASAPSAVNVIPKDGRVVVTWTMEPSVQYWIFHANGSGVTPQNCSSMPLCYTAINVTSPASVSGLTNGLLYSFSINGRKNGGPGGAGSAAKNATPRLAGTGIADAIWNLGTAPTANNLRGVTYGAYDTRFVAVGTGGALYSNTASPIDIAGNNGRVWTAMSTSTPLTTDLYAVSYDGAHAKYLSVGQTGTIMAMTPSVSTTWTPQTSNTPQNLYAIANNGGGFSVAAGANGTIVSSSDGSAWTPRISGTTNPLYGVTYGYSGTQYVFVAVGATGTALYSTDAITWTPGTSGVTSDLKSVTYGLVANVGTFVAVTADGMVITSKDGGKTWSASVAVPSVSSPLNAVTVSLNAAVPLSTTVTAVTNAFVAVDNVGNIFQSTDGGVTWPRVHLGSGPLYAVTHGGLFDYSAVGASGLNLYAD